MTIAFGPRAGAVIHALGGEEDHQHEHHALHVAPALELGELEHGERGVQRRRLRPLEEPPEGAPRPPRPEGQGHVRCPPVARRLQPALHGPKVGAVATLLPSGRDGLVDQRRLDVVDAPAPPAHAPDHGGQHGEAFLTVVAVPGRRFRVDHGEGV